MFFFNPRITADLLDNELIIANLDTGYYYTLKGSVINLIKRFPTENPELEIARFAEDYPSDIKDNIISDISQNWKELVSNGIVIEHEILPSSFPQFVFQDDGIFIPTVFTKFTDMKDFLLLDPVHEVDENGWGRQAQKQEETK